MAKREFGFRGFFIRVRKQIVPHRLSSLPEARNTNRFKSKAALSSDSLIFVIALRRYPTRDIQVQHYA